MFALVIYPLFQNEKYYINFEACLFWFMAYRKKNITSVTIFLVLNNPIDLVVFCVMATQQVVWIVLYACDQSCQSAGI